MDSSLTKVRRKNREVENDAWIRHILRHAPNGVFSVESDGQPYANANLFVFDEAAHSICFHTAGTGKLRNYIQANPRVCFSIFSMGRLLPAKKAVDFSTEYSSVVVFGNASVVTDDAQVTHIMGSFIKKYCSHIPTDSYLPFTLEDARRATIFKMEIREWSGKEHKEPEDFPGAFVYPGVPPYAGPTGENS